MRKFKTESKKLLDLMINSIYTNREIFLRELISNASDAIDKLHFASLTDSSIKLSPEDMAITVSFDADARTITVSDNGIGMDADALEKNLGTIAHSDSQEFKQTNAEAQGDDVDIIGQFGVGFYSGFMVAKQVKVITRAYGSDETNCWSSDGIEGYTIKACDQRDTHGTDVILTLKDDVEGKDGEEGDDYSRFLSEWALRDLITRYSNYVRHPVQMEVSKTRTIEPPEDAPEDAKPEYESYTELETINSMTPIWKKRSADVSDEDYNEFYKSTFHDFEDPARTVSFHAEGTLSYDALLFVPGRAPFDLYSKDYQKGLALYSSGVLIQEKCADLLPDYYNFVRGVVDSADVSLNISRETLQQDRQLMAIARRVERKIHSELVAMRDNEREAYEKVFENFGRGLKYGIYSSYGVKASELSDLLLFWSAREERMVTLAEYAAALKDGQDTIYYACGDDRERVSRLPQVKSALELGYDVLLCTQDVDEFTIQAMRGYHVDAVEGEGDDARDELDLTFQNVSSADFDLASDDEKEAATKAAEDNKALLDAMGKALDGKVGSVTVAAHLSDAVATVSASGPISLEMERVLSQDPAAADNLPKSERVLELNANHPVFAKLAEAQAAGDTERVDLYASVLYDQALMASGLPVDDPIAFANNITKLM